METKEKPISKAAQNKKDKQEAIARLKQCMPKGTTVYTILRHVSASGMTRHISIVILQQNSNNGNAYYPIHPNWAVSKALNLKLVSKNGYDAVVVNGCGMDMGFNIVHNISTLLYGWDEKGKYSHEGAYALKHQWL